MTQPIGKVTDLLGSGLFPSHPGKKPPLWENGRNVVFEYGLVKAALGQFLMFAPAEAARIMGIKAAYVAGTPTVYFGTPTKLWKWTESGGVEDLSDEVFSGGEGNPWIFALWGNWIAATNNTEDLKIYKNTGNFADLAGTPFTRCKVIESTNTHLFAMNTSNGGNYIEWTDVDDIEDWTATSTNEAGNKPMRNLDSDIIAAKKLGDSIIAYTYNEMLSIDYIGRPFIYGVNFLLEGFGPVGPNAVAAVGRVHYGFGRRGLWVTDGVSFDFIDEPAVFDFLFQDDLTRVDKTKLDQIVVWHDQMQNLVMFSYPTEAGLGHNDIQVGFNYKDPNKPWTVFNYGRMAVDDSGVFDFAVSGDQLGNIYQQSATNTAPSSGEQPIVELDETTYTLQLGVGEGGVGQLGVGGYESGTG